MNFNGTLEVVYECVDLENQNKCDWGSTTLHMHINNYNLAEQIRQLHK